MLAELFAVMMETPMLMIVFVVDVFLIVTILFFVINKLYKKKRPDQSLLMFFKRFKLKRSKGGVKNVESLYDFVIDNYLGRGSFSRGLGRGFKAREMILKSIKERKKPAEFEVVKAVFDGFEMKKYGGGVYNEETVVNNLFSRFRAL
ncbi:MAG: hypothetical protein GOV00_00480 [Candidatus Altiarchaeota archaeon]|nr:hypothetical protein [Candidatus Altiarchaeota archaeon]